MVIGINLLKTTQSVIRSCIRNGTNRPTTNPAKLLPSPNTVSTALLKNLPCDTVEFSTAVKFNTENASKNLSEYISINRGVGNNKCKKNIVSLIQRLKRGEIKVDKLSDGEILDIWSWRYYDGQLKDFPEIQRSIVERFNSICKNNNIVVQPNEILIRTIPEEGISFNSNIFSLGKPDSILSNWPASMAKVEKIAIEEGKTLPEHAIARIIDDKINYLLKHPECANGKIPDSTVYVTLPKNTEYTIRGFDWSKIGIPKESGFGSPAFRKEVNSYGLSTEVNVPGELKFKRVQEDRIIPFSLPEPDGRNFNIRVVYVEPV